MTRTETGRSAITTRFSWLIWLTLACLGLTAQASQAGSLDFYEASVGRNQLRVISGPVTNALIDLDYAPSTAEGGRLYGVSEISIETTGNVVLTPTNFACQAASCLFSPSPFVTGKRIRITAGNDLLGETASAAHFLTVRISGSSGYVALIRGTYLDGTGTAGGVGAVQTPDVTLLVRVPETDLGVGLAAACALLGLAGRSSGRPRRLRTPA